MEFKYFQDPDDMEVRDLRDVYEVMQDEGFQRVLDVMLNGRSKAIVEDAMETMLKSDGNLTRDAGAWLYLKELVLWFVECHQQFRNLMNKGGLQQ